MRRTERLLRRSKNHHPLQTGNWTDDALETLENLNIEDYGKVLKRLSQGELRASNGILTQAETIISGGSIEEDKRDAQAYKPERAAEQEKQIED